MAAFTNEEGPRAASPTRQMAAPGPSHRGRSARPGRRGVGAEGGRRPQPGHRREPGLRRPRSPTNCSSWSDPMGTDRLDEVLDATYDCLTRYGVRRTTMDDIATAMRVSVRGLPVRPQQGRRLPAARRAPARAGLEQARRAAADTGATYQDRVRGVLAAKLDLVLRTVRGLRTPPNSSTTRPGCSAGSAPPSPPICTPCSPACSPRQGTVAGIEPADAAHPVHRPGHGSGTHRTPAGCCPWRRTRSWRRCWACPSHRRPRPRSLIPHHQCLFLSHPLTLAPPH